MAIIMIMLKSTTIMMMNFSLPFSHYLSATIALDGDGDGDDDDEKAEVQERLYR